MFLAAKDAEQKKVVSGEHTVCHGERAVCPGWLFCAPCWAVATAVVMFTEGTSRQ